MICFIKHSHAALIQHFLHVEHSTEELSQVFMRLKRRRKTLQPESYDGTLLANVALGLVLGGLGGGHAVQDGQPHHGLGLHAHPVQEHGGFQLRFVVGLRGRRGCGGRG